MKIKMQLTILSLLKKSFWKSEGRYSCLEKEINGLSKSFKMVEQETYSIDSDLSVLRKDLKNNSRLILSSSKTELSNRLYLAQSLLDRLESGVPYSPQLEALGKEGLDPALLRFANGRSTYTKGFRS